MSQGAAIGLRLREDDAVIVGPRHAGRPPVASSPAEARRLVEALPVEAGARGAISRPWTESLDGRLLGIADILAMSVAAVVVLGLLGDARASVAVLACGPLALFLFKLAGLYGRDERLISVSTLDETPRLLQQTGLVALGVVIVESVVSPRGLGGAAIAALWIACFATVTAGRLMARRLTRRFTAVERCLVVGELDQANRLRERLAESRARARVVACVPLSDEDLTEVDGRTLLSSLIRDLRVNRLIVVPTMSDARDGFELIRAAKAVGVSVSVLPRIFDAIGSDVEFDEVNGLTLLGVRSFGLPDSARVVKRAFDIVVGSLGFLAIAPMMLAIALAVRLDSSGPVFFRQVRVGRNGRHFHMIKFRSMVTDADALKDRLRTLSDPGDGLFKIADDPRVTRVGRLLRQTSLDELPQLFNVLQGEMSLVGPRPLVIDEDAKIAGLERSRLHLTPGMTGPWQILDSRLPLKEMVEVDYRYVANWSLWIDLKILLRTVAHVTRGGNV
jgi:exopolysaccharide biosynthesis polyprenyl glycosylphosphotransferase